MPLLSHLNPEMTLLGQPLSSSWLLGLLMFAFVSSITPGPNNILLASLGARFGARRTLPHAAGIWAGMVSLLALSALGVGALAANAPAVVGVLQVAASVALLWTALSMLRPTPMATPGTPAEVEDQPWSFWQGVGFQYLNPKALMMAVTAVAMTPMATIPSAKSVVLMISTFMIISIPSTWLWVMTGAALRQALNSPRRTRTFNITMAVLLVATIPLGLIPAMRAP